MSRTSSDELSSLEDESEESSISTLLFPFLLAGVLAGFFSSDESSESDVSTVFLGCSSSEEESEESSDDSSLARLTGAFPFDALSTFYGGCVKRSEGDGLTTGIHTALAKISLDDASDFAFAGEAAAVLATLALSAVFLSAFLSDFAMVCK